MTIATKYACKEYINGTNNECATTTSTSSTTPIPTLPIGECEWRSTNGQKYIKSIKYYEFAISKIL